MFGAESLPLVSGTTALGCQALRGHRPGNFGIGVSNVGEKGVKQNAG